MKSVARQVRAALGAAILCFTTARPAQAHAFLDHGEPAVGSTIRQMPPEVKLTFTQELEPAFSRVQVFDATGRQVDGKNVHLDPKDGKVLIVSLLGTLGAGTYKVVWRVVSKDTHVTQGDFTFAKEP